MASALMTPRRIAGSVRPTPQGFAEPKHSPSGRKAMPIIYRLFLLDFKSTGEDRLENS
jgi:hypothetical protein